MKKTLMSGVTVLAWTGITSATLLTQSFTGNEAIPDGNAVGVANNLTISDPGGALIQDVSVTLNMTGGYNGDLYGYLVFQPTGGGTAPMDVLLNQIGTGPGNAFGSATAGFNNVTLTDSGSGSIHTATGTAGQQIAPGTYTPDSTSTLDATFGGISADGTWTLFLADLSAGGGTSDLTGWTLNISVVPEPITWALAGFAGLLVLARYLAWRRTQRV